MAIKSVQVRVEETMLKKMTYISEYEGRSLNTHLLVVMREHIKQFEKQHGKIEGDIAPDDNVRLGRK